MDLNAFFESEFVEHLDVVTRTRSSLRSGFIALTRACVDVLRSGGKLMLFGNGGSAADAQHLATELTVRYKRDRAPIAALALTTDTSALTATGNDLGFERLFARQIEALGRPGDMALAISTSGKSPNILAALRAAREMRLVTAALSGKGGGDLRALTDHLLVVPSDTTARIQEMHITLGHMLCEAIEVELGLARG